MAPKTSRLVSGVESPKSTTWPSRLGVWKGWPASVSRRRNQVATARPPRIPTSVPSAMVEWVLSSMRTSGSRPGSCDACMRNASHWGPDFRNARLSDAGSPRDRVASRRSRRVGWGLYLRSQVGIIKRSSQAGVPSPEKPGHGPHTQDASAQRSPPGKPLVGERVEHQQVTDEQQKPDHQTEPYTHAKRRVLGGKVCQPDEYNPQHQKHREMQEGVLGHGLRHHVNSRGGVAAHEDLPENVRCVQRLASSQVHQKVPNSNTQPADQTGEQSFTQDRMLPAFHVGSRL